VTVDVRIIGWDDVIASTASEWDADRRMQRLWEKDPTVWFDPARPEIEDRLGWLDLPTTSATMVDRIEDLAAEARRSGVTDLVLCGMGGSSLAPEVFAATLPHDGISPRLTVIDTTHPDAVTAVADATDPRSTWYLISSKSGTTLETASLFAYFWDVASAALERPGDHFVAVTDPGSSLAGIARARGFRSTFLADPTVGGRYSALSAFGLVPAGITGADTGALLASGRVAAIACGPDVPLTANPGFMIGSVLGAAAREGRPVAIFDAADPVASLPIWIEQLIAESTGKDGRGIIPIDDGPVPSQRRGIVTVSLGAKPRTSADIAITVTDPYDVAAAMFVMEVATAVAGRIIGIHPFDQPDVQLAKSLAHRAMEGALPSGGAEPLAIGDPSVRSLLEAAHMDGALYVAVQAYVAPDSEVDTALAGLRDDVTAHIGPPVALGYGPRYLHSTGQIHKGGPDGGVFIQIVDHPVGTVPVPGTDYTFSQLVAAQAAGDRAALAERGRTVIPLDVGDAVVEGIETLHRLVIDVAGG
jgi:transaldolase/glucose-6-phosphate isomerase